MKRKAIVLLFFLANLIFFNINVFCQTNSTPLWSIGTPDGSAKEFDLYNSSYEKFSSSYKNGIILFEIGKNSDKDLPYIFPGRDDGWANNINSQLVVNFGISSISGSGSSRLRMNFVETHPAANPRLEITVNNFKTYVNAPKGNNKDFPGNKKTISKDLFVEVEIPDGVLKKKDNVLIIRNVSGSWVVFDNISLFAPSTVKAGKSTGDITALNGTTSRMLIYGENKEIQHPIELPIVNWSKKSKNVSIHVDGKTYKNANLHYGINTIEIGIPETKTPREAKIEVLSGNKVISTSNIEIEPVKEWNVYLIQHTHTDIGYTKPQTEILTEHLRYIDYVIEYCEMTENYPDDAKFRWTCEASWAVREYLENRPAEQIEKLKKYITNGQIELTAMFFNMAEIVDENSFKTFLEPIAEFKKHNLPVKTAMQNDVNGIAWCLADYFPDLGVKYVWLGEHGHRALIPFDKPTVFNWESPSGKAVTAYRSDHYNTGNFLGVEHGNAEMIKTKLSDYLKNLENKNYPFDAIAIQYSGYFTDNSPASTKTSELVKEWNSKYASPRLRCALPSEFMDYISEKYPQKLESFKVAYPDWWTDGFGSAARETGASRKTHSDMITIEGMLSMAVSKGQKMPQDLHKDIRHIHERLLFYDEHTFGSHASISDPMDENCQIQWAEKSSFAWEGLKSAQMLYETAIGLLQNNLRRSNKPTITFFNTMGWNRSGVQNVYIDYEIIPKDIAFKIVDKDGKPLAIQPLHSRSEGRYYAILAEDIPAMGYKTYEIIVEKQNVDPLPNANLTGNVLENEYYKLKIDPSKGAIVSLYDKQLDKEMVDSGSDWSLGEFIYEKLGNRNQMERYTFTDYTRSSLNNCKVSAGVNGPIYQSVNITGKSDGVDDKFGVKIEVRLYHNSKRIELAYATRRLPETDPSGIYVSFPFKLDNAKLAYDVQGGVVYPGENQLEGTTTEWYTVQNYVSARNEKTQYIIGSDVVPLFQLGDMLGGPFQYKKTYEKPHVFSWVMNNYWTTNFRASQEGEFRWSYYLTSSDDVTDASAAQFAWNSRVPLYARVIPAGKPDNKAWEYSAFKINNPELLMTSCTPSKDEGYVLLNVREVAGKSNKLEITDASGKALKFEIVNAIEEKIGNPTTQDTFVPYGNKFIKIRIDN